MVNAVGFLVPNSFEGDIEYLTLRLLDTPSEDMLSVFYDVFDFIENARAAGGKVFVHCSQGVSRSAALVIAYIMWKTGKNYDEVFQSVKDVRGVVNPNIGTFSFHVLRGGEEVAPSLFPFLLFLLVCLSNSEYISHRTLSETTTIRTSSPPLHKIPQILSTHYPPTRRFHLSVAPVAEAPLPDPRPARPQAAR